MAERPDAAAGDDAALVAAAQGGDRAAFAELYQRYGRMVRGILISSVGIGDADDVLQEVFMTAMQQLTALRDPLAFGGWLATIARNKGVDHLRRRPVQTELPDDLAGVSPDGIEAQSEALAVLAAIRGLPAAYRETLTLRLIEGMTGPEIARRTGLTEGSVRVNLHRGMQQLRARLGGGLT
jgi:RNA polymerase sigma-70 factor (ECF subfamily)